MRVHIPLIMARREMDQRKPSKLGLFRTHEIRRRTQSVDPTILVTSSAGALIAQTWLLNNPSTRFLLNSPTYTARRTTCKRPCNATTNDNMRRPSQDPPLQNLEGLPRLVVQRRRDVNVPMVMMARLVVQRRRDVNVMSMMTTMAHDDADDVTWSYHWWRWYDRCHPSVVVL